MALRRILDEYAIDVDAMERMKKRVFVVGRFNQARVGDDPDVFLFTKNPEAMGSDRYRANFTKVLDLSYDDFVSALEPAIAEKIKQGRRFPRIEQVIPGSEEDLKRSFVIDLYNYFFTRAVSNSSQAAFQDVSSEMDEILVREESKQGVGILRQIRQDLKQFSEFQHQNYRMVEAAAQLLHRCTGDDLPAYDYGGSLPGGFPEALINFLYSEDPNADFDASNLDFAVGDWDALAENQRLRDRFEKVLTAFRNAAVFPKTRAFGTEMFRGRSLDDLAAEVMDPELRKSFASARRSFNQLRQILRSKVLLSMVMEWVVNSLDQIPDVKDKKNLTPDEKNEVISRAIHDRHEENGLAAPVKRPSEEERERFAKELRDNLGSLVRALVGSDADFKSRRNEFSGEQVARLADELREDEALVSSLRRIVGVDDADRLEGFLGANETLIMDLLCPKLFRSPITTSGELRRNLRRETVQVYLAAVLLSDENEEGILKIAEDHLEAMESQIEDDEIRDRDKIAAAILKDYVRFLADPAVEETITESMKALTEAGLLREQMSRDRRGVADTVPVGMMHEEAKATRKTKIPAGALLGPLEKYLTKGRPETVGDPSSSASAGSEERVGESDSTRASVPGSADGESIAFVDEEYAKAKAEILRMAGEDGQTEVGGEPVVDDATVIRATLERPGLVGAARETLMLRDQGLQIIYERYKKKGGQLKTFGNKVERLSLTNLMLLFEEDLDLGRSSSHLFKFLLDLILTLDPERPDPMAFLGEKSLTEYFDNVDLGPEGIRELRRTLRIQAEKSMKNIVDFVSELRGMKYLIDKLTDDRQVELVVVNATANEFLEWLETDNLTPGEGSGDGKAKGRLSAGKLERGRADETIPPGLVYMTDIAFASGPNANADGAKRDWIEGLKTRQLAGEGLRYVLPPLCLSTGPQTSGSGTQSFDVHGRSYAAAAAEAPAGITVVGPSPLLNSPGDSFKTVLPAGYLLTARFLGKSIQDVTNVDVDKQSEGRFCVLGTGQMAMQRSLDEVLWGPMPGRSGEPHALAVDFYLYIILSMAATTAGLGGESELREMYHDFYEQGVNPHAIWLEEIPCYSDALLDGAGEHYAFANEPKSDGAFRLTGVYYHRNRGIDEKTRAEALEIAGVDWFNVARKLSKLP